MLSRVLASIPWLSVVAAPVCAQEPDERAVRACLVNWSAAFERGEADPAVAVPEDDARSPFGQAETAQIRTWIDGAIDQHSVLVRLTGVAERRTSWDATFGLLVLAAAGLTVDEFDPAGLVVRELGQQSLTRAGALPAVGDTLLRVARGEATAESDAALSEPIRAAAILALGANRAPDLPRLAADLLSESDPRLRLAVAESLETAAMREALPTLRKAVILERHGIVSQAVVRAIGRTLELHAPVLAAGEREAAVRATLRALDRSGWRTDLAIVELVERQPIREAVPALIELFARTEHREDRLRDAVNTRASSTLRYRTWQTLRLLTGTLLPYEDVIAWRRFWIDHGDDFVLPTRSIGLRMEARTRAQFFGITVAGRRVAFVIDVSISMRQPVGTQTDSGPQNERTRLDLAKEQMLLAVQAMDPASTFELFTFAGDVQRATDHPLHAKPADLRLLTNRLARLEVRPATNFYDTLRTVLTAVAEGDGFDEVFLLSDGEPTAGRVTEPGALLDLVEQANRYRRVRIHTVHVGGDTGGKFLEDLAYRNDGVFVTR